MTAYKIIDADAHMSEPGNLWVERIERQWRDRAPRAVKDPEGKKGMFFVFEDFPPMRMSAEGEGVSQDMERPGGWDPAERLKDMAVDGIDAAVLYTTFGFMFFWCQDAGLQEACFRVYNEWLAEFCRYAPEKLAGLGMVSLYDVERGRQELERCKKRGLKGAMIWAVPPEAVPPYSAPVYDPFWAAAQDLEMPISLHLNTAGRRAAAYDFERDVAGMFVKMVTASDEVQHSLLTLIFAGVLERFPRLRFVSAEGDIAWIPHLLARADKYFESRHRRGYKLELALKPSEYFRRQVYATFIKDPLGLKLYRLGDCVDNIMWSTDYPHPASFFPHSQEILARDFAGVPEEDKRKIVRDNAATLYGFQLD